MQLKSTYQKDKYLTVICEDFDPTETTCQKLQQMLESAKFVLISGEFAWQWQRQEFKETPKSSFQFWLSQVTKLCDEYGNEPAEVISRENLTTDSENQGVPYQSILTELAQLKEEIVTLKKFDSDANKKLQRLNEAIANGERGKREEGRRRIGKRGGKAKKVKPFGIEAFTPIVEFLDKPIILGDDDLKWTERFRSGVFCFYNDQLGISFKNAHKGLEWDVERKYCGANLKVHKEVRNITCRIPILPGTFQPINAPKEQIELMRRLLEGAFIVEDLLLAESTHQDDEECDCIRSRLNQFYDSFVPEFGLLVNCGSYYDGLWPDVRLEIYLSQLTDSAGNKSDIFRKRINHPPQEATGQQFFEEDLETRLTNAFSWCMGWHGETRLDEIAEKSGVDCDRALEILQKLGLVYRHWVGFDSQSWWEMLGVDADIDSAFELKMAYREKVKIWHPDTNSSTYATKMMQLLNDAYEKAAIIVGGRSPKVALRDRTLGVNIASAITSVSVTCGKHLGVCEVPREKPGQEKEFALIELATTKAISFFYSVSGALSCLKELEARYIGSWHPDHPNHNKYQQIRKFYK